MSKKLCHNWHGPYTLVGRTSPVNYVIRAADNSRISTTVHVSRMKPYYDPATRPIRHPPVEVDELYLQEADFPADSFMELSHSAGPTYDSPEAIQDTPDDSSTPPSPPDESTEVPSVSNDPDVFTAEKTIRQRLYRGKPQFEIKWKGYRETSWEALENILDRSLITNYYRDHPRARHLVAGNTIPANVNALDFPIVAAYTMSSTANFNSTPRYYAFASALRQREATLHSSQHSRTNASFLQIFWTAVLLTTVLGSSLVNCSRLDASGKPVTFYPDSRMPANNPQALVFLGPVPNLSNSCSPQQKRFFDQLLLSVRAIQRVIRRLGSFQGITNIMECDSFLRRYYFYLNGKDSQLVCTTRRFASSPQQCRS